MLNVKFQLKRVSILQFNMSNYKANNLAAIETLYLTCVSKIL